MHFVTGGAFNGKRAWVKEYYPKGEWISAYKGAPLRKDFRELSSAIIVLEGIEMWTKELSAKMIIDQAREYLRSILDEWLDWENAASNRKMVIIGTDIMKGIVPIEEADRNWRDLTGWVYQDLTFRCKQVDVIWYGIQQMVKNEMFIGREM